MSIHELTLVQALCKDSPHIYGGVIHADARRAEVTAELNRRRRGYKAAALVERLRDEAARHRSPIEN